LVHTIVNQEWALRHEWNPASTIKLVTAMAGVTEQMINPAERIRVGDKDKPMNLTDALANSNNEYFRVVADRIGAEQIIKYAKQASFGELTGINYEHEIAGYLPDYQTNFSASELGAYGEGIKVTPIQLAVFTSAIANGGKIVVPHVAHTEAEQFQT